MWFSSSGFILHSDKLCYMHDLNQWAPCEGAIPDISTCYTSQTRIVTRRQQQSHITFSVLLWCAASQLCCVYIKNLHEGVWVSEIYRCWKSNDIFPCLSSLILHQHVGVRAGLLHMLHPLMAAYKVTFISPARIFSEVSFRWVYDSLSSPFLCCVKHILFLVNCLSLSTSSIPLCGLWTQVVFRCRKMYTSDDRWLLFTTVLQLHMSKLQRV